MKRLRLHRHATAFFQLFNAGLRLMSLSTKLLLTLYMGRYLGLTEMGTYGLMAAYVAIAIPLLGMRLDYVVAREIIDLEPVPLTVKLRNQGVFYGLNYLAFIALAALAVVLFPDRFDLRIVVFALAISISESIGAVSAGNLVSLRQPVLSTVLFFIRSALWVFPVMLLGYFYPALRSAEFIFICWLAGVILSLLLTVIVWHKLPWGAALGQPIDWAWMRRSMKSCLPIWLGAVGAAAAGNLDRFVAESFLGRDFVGLASFYGSFVLAMISLLQNGVIAFGYPKLVSYFKQNDLAGFRAEVWHMTRQSALSVAVMSLAIGLVVPWLGNHFGRPEFALNAPTLWLMLLGAWIKCLAESLYYVLYARHQDVPIWSGNLLLLLVSLISGVGFVWAFGFVGIGYSATLSGTFILLWRIYWVKHYNDRPPGA